MKNPILHLLKTTIAFVTACGLPTLSALSATWVTWDPSAGGNGHSYLAVPGYPGLTWNVASQLAQAQGGYLATINSAAENDFVFGLVNSPLFFSAYNGSGPALGGYNAGTPSNPAWSWVTGEPWTFSNWLPGTPDYADFGPGPEDRLEYFSSIGGTPANTWNDLHHDDGNIGGYVIEVVPEPHSLCLLAVALAFAANFRKMKTRSHQDSTKSLI
jgi:hypothetical protein